MSTDAMRAAALKIVAAYDAYRHRGMAPAPGEYAGLVAAIEEARAALAQPVSAERVPLTDELLMRAFWSTSPGVLIQQVLTVTVWKDGIDVQAPTMFLRDFARAIERVHGIAC